MKLKSEVVYTRNGYDKHWCYVCINDSSKNLPQSSQSIRNSTIKYTKFSEIQCNRCDFSDKTLVEREFESNHGVNIAILPVDNILSGMYLLQMKNESGNCYTSKLIIKKDWCIVYR